MESILTNEGVLFKNNKIHIPSHIKRIKLDIGISTEAIHTEDWLNKNPNDLMVFGFEALPLCISETKKYFNQTVSKWKNTSNIIDLKWLNNQFIIVPVALGNNIISGENIDFFVTSKDVGCSSTLKPSDLLTSRHGISLDHVIKVPIFTLSDFFQILPLDSIDYIEYIKVDVQGTDLEVIKSGGKYISEKVVFVTMEPESETYSGSTSNTLENMIDYMNSIGFKFIQHKNTKDPTFLNTKFQDISDSIYISQFN
jgi:hypothetical protein